MNKTPSGERVHIGIFGKRNAGKSSLLNAIASQQSAVVSDTPGTTTDPVKKVMELLPLGPVVLIDTPGLDDEGELGRLRVKQTENVLRQVDMALLVLDERREPEGCELELVMELSARKVPYIIVYNKSDRRNKSEESGQKEPEEQSQKPEQKESEQVKEDFAGHKKQEVLRISVSAKAGFHIHELKDMMAGLLPQIVKERPLIGDLISPGDLVVLVVPIDSAAPKGRLILPQQMVLREVLDCHGKALVVQDTELAAALLDCKKKPALVVTDSQVFAKVMQVVPEDIPLTSFSILLARKKGNLDQVVKGAHQMDLLHDGDKILISEGCTHHRQCDDIGTVKLPAWIRKHSGVQCEFAFTSGGEFPEDLTEYALIVHCGGCMLNDRELQHRQQQAVLQGVPMTNYGTAIAHMNGILERSLKVLG